MNLVERLIHFQNQAEKDFQEKINIPTSVNYLLALVIFLFSTLVAGFTMPVRLLMKAISKKKKYQATICNMNSKNVDAILKNEPLVLIDFWAEWCGPCIMMNPTLEEFASRSGNICIAKVNSDLNRDILKKFNIRGIPHFLLIKNGKEIKRHAGPMTLSDLNNFCFEFNRKAS